VPVTNWARNVTFGAREFHTPTSTAQLQQLVARSQRARALGSGHSFNRIADTTGVLVSVARLPRVFEIDSARAQVTVNAGARYGEVTPGLHDKGFALANLGSLPHISIAGACATGTHGSGNALGNLATQVDSIEFVAASGDLVHLSREGEPARFDGAVIALGCLGIVTRLTLRLVPSFDVAQYAYDSIADQDLDEHIQEILAGGYSVSVFTDLRTNRLWRKVLAGEPADGQPWFGARPSTAPQHPVPGMPVEHSTQQLGVPGPWYERLPHFRLEFTPSNGDELQTEYLLPRQHAADALVALRDLRAQIGPVLQVSEIRTVAADELWLSPSYHRDSVAVHFTWVADPAAVAPVIAAIEQRLAPFEPRPHWGKIFGMAPDAVRAQYDRLADFARLRSEFDPTGKFGNDLVARYLSPAGSRP
jgi:xylitol oxidase